MHASAGRTKQIRPVTLNLPVLQQIQAEPVPVEAQAGLEVADHHHGMMNSSGHGTQANKPWRSTCSLAIADSAGP